MAFESGEARSHKRDKALRRTRALIAVAAQAFKGHPQRSASPTPAVAKSSDRPRPARVNVPGPQSVPSIAGQPAPLQPPAQPPAAAPPANQSAPAPAPQVSGG